LWWSAKTVAHREKQAKGKGGSSPTKREIAPGNESGAEGKKSNVQGTVPIPQRTRKEKRGSYLTNLTDPKQSDLHKVRLLGPVTKKKKRPSQKPKSPAPQSKKTKEWKGGVLQRRALAATKKQKTIAESITPETRQASRTSNTSDHKKEGMGSKGRKVRLSSTGGDVPEIVPKSRAEWGPSRCLGVGKD